MLIERGLASHMVLQRAEDNACDAEVCGWTAATGMVLVRVFRSGQPVRGFIRPRRIGMAGNGRLRCQLSGIPCGGPYRIELVAVDAESGFKDRFVATDVLVGDVWALCGQSNMVGVGALRDKYPPDPLVRAYYMDNRWALAVDPLHNLWEAADECHRIIAGGPIPARGGVGPGVAFGVRMRELTGIPQGLIPCAQGGVGISLWDPDLHKRVGHGTLFRAFVERVRWNGGHIAGVLWYQGEADTRKPEAAGQYLERFRKIAAAMRRQTPCRRGGILPIAVVQIGRVASREKTARPEPWNQVQDIQRRLPEAVRHLTVVPAVDLNLTDWIHLDGRSQHILGRRLADAMHTLRGGVKAQPPPISLKAATLLPRPDSAAALPTVRVAVEFENVAGHLISFGRPHGFSTNVEDIIEVELKKSGVELVMRPWINIAADATVSYGAGGNPYCNITDQAGRPLPAFGPHVFAPARLVTGFVRRLRVSAPQPGAGRLQRLAYPAAPGSLCFKSIDFAGQFVANFCDVSAMLRSAGDDDPLLFLACKFACQRRGALAARLGYDGPVRVWLDGKCLFHDPAGCNPAVEDAALIPFTAGRGEHELLVALGSNGQKACGIFLRFEVPDCKPEKILDGSGVDLLPRFIH